MRGDSPLTGRMHDMPSLVLCKQKGKPCIQSNSEHVSEDVHTASSKCGKSSKGGRAQKRSHARAVQPSQGATLEVQENMNARLAELRSKGNSVLDAVRAGSTTLQARTIQIAEALEEQRGSVADAALPHEVTPRASTPGVQADNKDSPVLLLSELVEVSGACNFAIQRSGQNRRFARACDAEECGDGAEDVVGTSCPGITAVNVDKVQVQMEKDDFAKLSGDWHDIHARSAGRDCKVGETQDSQKELYDAAKMVDNTNIASSQDLMKLLAQVEFLRCRVNVLTSLVGSGKPLTSRTPSLESLQTTPEGSESFFAPCQKPSSLRTTSEGSESFVAPCQKPSSGVSKERHLVPASSSTSCLRTQSSGHAVVGRASKKRSTVDGTSR
eukprot:TRINITY_DN7361_c0_g1_i1.p1 TRINITY_DN7361_c0_g1~~TRINITY_DN7361_c0_g1_i1.p1  ORF type:complete len:384 (+),score=55.95 TRINITY_DN7361_c0_g1_i1:106-1257(+)